MLRKLAILALTLVVTCAAARAGQVEMEVNVGFGPTIDVPYGQAHVYWAKIINEQSDGTIKMNVFPSDQLGSGKDTIDQAWMGDPVVYSTDVAMFADLGVPDIGILQAPYLCETWEQMQKLFDSEWWKGQEKLLEEKGFKVLANNWRYGDRHTITIKPVKEPKDLAGLKIRVPQRASFTSSPSKLSARPPLRWPCPKSTPPCSRASSTAWKIPSPPSGAVSSTKWPNTSPSTPT